MDLYDNYYFMSRKTYKQVDKNPKNKNTRLRVFLF